MVNWSSDSSRIPPEQQIRDSLIRSIDGNGATPSTFLDLLDTVTQPGEETWRKLNDRRDKPFKTFTDFVTAERPEGLGLHGSDDLRKHLELEHKEEREPYRRQATIDRMAAMRKRVGKLLHEDRPEAPDRPPGRPPENERTTLINPPRTDVVDRVVARLKRDDPGLARQVINGEISPDAAARQKGWRKPRIVLTSPESVAKRLRGYFTDPEQRRLLARLLLDEQDPR